MEIPFYPEVVCKAFAELLSRQYEMEISVTLTKEKIDNAEEQVKKME